MDVGVSDCLRYAHVREVVSFLLATPESVAQFLFFCCTPSTAPQLLKQQLFQQVLGQQQVLMRNICLKCWGLPGQAQANLKISHNVSVKSVLGKVFCSPESEKVTFSRFLLPALYLCEPMHKLSLGFTPRHGAVVFKKASLNFLILHFCIVPSVRIAHYWII